MEDFRKFALIIVVFVIAEVVSVTVGLWFIASQLAQLCSMTRLLGAQRDQWRYLAQQMLADLAAADRLERAVRLYAAERDLSEFGYLVPLGNDGFKKVYR